MATSSAPPPCSVPSNGRPASEKQDDQAVSRTPPAPRASPPRRFLRLKQLSVGGLVTDGSVRDTDELLNYGFPVFSFSTTPKQGPAAMQPWECDGVISCGNRSMLKAAS